jgi:hypothetical protein
LALTFAEPLSRQEFEIVERPSVVDKVAGY